MNPQHLAYSDDVLNKLEDRIMRGAKEVPPWLHKQLETVALLVGYRRPIPEDIWEAHNWVFDLQEECIWDWDAIKALAA